MSNARRSAAFDELEVVDAEDFSMRLDIWVAHSLRVGNLQRAAELLADAVAEGYAAHGQP